MTLPLSGLRRRATGRLGVILVALACAGAAATVAALGSARPRSRRRSSTTRRRRAKALFVLGRDTLEVIVALENWTKVRDVGEIGWVEKKTLAERRTLVVRVPLAEIRATPDDAAPLLFRAELNVLLEPAEAVTSASATASPGWVKVRHRDGQTGFVRVAQVFGL
jgi:SH3-like domain-containing protein